MCVGSTSKAPKLIKFHPCGVKELCMSVNILMLQKRIWFCNWVLKNMHDGLIVSQLLFITDEADFPSNSYVNSQSKRIWSDRNPHAVKILLHDIRIGVWCAVIVR
jgi:hypothetical protein